MRFEHRLAGPGPRAAAWLFDFALRGVVASILGVLAMSLSVIPGLGGFGMGAFLLALFLLDWGYGAVFETLMEGRTPGKWLLALRVVRQDGSPGRWPDFALRNLLRAVDFLPVGFGVGVLAMFTDKQLRRIGDLVAGTVVVSEQSQRMLAAVPIVPPITEAERRSLPARVDLEPASLESIEAFLRRRRRLTDGRAEELASLCAEALCERFAIPPPTDGRAERVLTLLYARATNRDRQ